MYPVPAMLSHCPRGPPVSPADIARFHYGEKYHNSLLHRNMSPMLCMCSTMFRIDPQHLAWVLENLVEGQVVNQISVAEDVADNARTALQRMFDL